MFAFWTLWLNAWVMAFLQKHLRWRDITENGVLYMRRFYLWQGKRFSVFIHYIARSDYARHLHDHPWNFFALRLSGGYREVLPSGQGLETRTAWRPMFTGTLHKAEDLHRIELKKPVWTLFIHGRRRREWGFQTEAGWIHWTKYPKAGEDTGWQKRHPPTA